MLNLMLKAKYSFISALVFFIVANPETYSITHAVFGLEGMNALLLHTTIFFFVMLGLMLFPSTA
jgi:hypothetical protein